MYALRLSQRWEYLACSDVREYVVGALPESAPTLVNTGGVLALHSGALLTTSSLQMSGRVSPLALARLLSLSRSILRSLPLARSHTRSRSLSHTFSLSISLARLLSLSRSILRSLSLARSHTRPRCLSLTFSLSISLALLLFLSLSFSLSLSRSLSLLHVLGPHSNF